MRILVISDVHANLPALERVLESVSCDDIVFLGDAVDYGPQPLEVCSRLNEVGAKRVLGNHDAAAALGIDCGGMFEMREPSVLTRRRITVPQMPEKDLAALGRADRTLDLDYEGLRVRLVHASPADELYGYVTREDASKLEVPGADILFLGHTHVPYQLKTEDVWVVNPGSVGLPRDGDPRASFAILETDSRSVELRRVDYDIEGVVSRLHQLIGEEKSVYDFLATTLRTGS